MESYFKNSSLLPCIVQSERDGEVLMLGYMNEEALEKTLSSGFITFYSRSRKALWTKGESSGNKIELVALYHDCDQDTFLAKGEEWGPCCHTGKRSCFQEGEIFRRNPGNTGGTNKRLDLEATGIKGDMEEECLEENILNQLFQRIECRKENPVEGSYTNYLLDKGVDKICKKIGEESAEVIIAAKSENEEAELLNEAGDLLYHVFVLLAKKNLKLSMLLKVLKERFQVQGNKKEKRVLA